MKRGLDLDALRRVWEYNIEPFIEDQFFGDPAQIERFRFEDVLRRYQAEAEVAIDEATGTAEPTSPTVVGEAQLGAAPRPAAGPDNEGEPLGGVS